MAKKRISKVITNQSDVNEIINLTYDRACEKSLLMDFFADFGNGPRFNTYDTIEIPKGAYGGKKKNKNSFVTTVGLWVFNKSFIEPFADVIGYINEPITGKMYDNINNKISYALLEGKVTLDQVKDFINQTQIMMSCASAICPSHTMDLMLFTTKAEKKKVELEKKYKDGLKENDLTTVKNIENELIDYAKEELKDSESVDMYNSGARSSWGNNFKNMYLVKGSIKKTDGSYDYVSSSLISGLKPKDFAKINDAGVGGPYSRSQKTRSGGYDEKLYTRSTQHIKVIPHTDCGTKRTIDVTLTKKNINNWMYSYYMQGSTPVEITSENKDRLIGKTVKMRYSSLCEYKKGGCMCETCAGTLFRRADIENAGLVSMIMMSSVKNKAMKAFHDSTLELVELDLNEVFSL